MLEESSFEFAFKANAAVGLLNAHDDGGMRPSQNLSQQYPRLCVAIVVRLQAGKDQVELFIFDRRGQSFRGVERIQRNEFTALEMKRAIGSLGQRFAQNLLCTRRTRGDYNYFATMLLFLSEGLFERVGIRLIDLVGDVLANPGAAFIEL